MTHISVYYIGGPRDCMKEARQAHPREPRITIREIGRLVPNPGSGARLAEYSDHTYLLRQIGRDTYAAIYEALI